MAKKFKCDDLLKTQWKKYSSSVPNVPEKSGIYAIGKKRYKDEDIEYLYGGQSNNMKRRLKEHKSPTPQQDIDKRVVRKFKQHRESDLVVKYVATKREKTVEGPCIESLTKKKGYFPVLNKRAGDSSTSNSANPMKSNPQNLVEFLLLGPSQALKCKPLEDPFLSEPSKP